MGIISGFLELFGCNSRNDSNPNSSNDNNSNNTILIAKQIKIDELEGQLNLLQTGKTEFDFIGITSNGIDCIYFMKEGNKLQIEFEAMILEQLPYIESLREFANQNGIETTDTDYGNQPRYESKNPAPVLRLNVNADIKKAAELGRLIETVIFKNNDNAKYDVVL
ncbi:hypothetical protein [Flavobacterium okayamense]|uniref:Lipoprotein n=1 Tax=Flavobacterium okayamense TaxID=2830782 RepID=A0ABN6I2W1_9FLAO|nr:hypothetical protein [Flavobacterium okayamense]BCY28778.1 hypothetical protein KK2020170_16460 [Flavobacterium okayamense]